MFAALIKNDQFEKLAHRFILKNELCFHQIKVFHLLPFSGYRLDIEKKISLCFKKSDPLAAWNKRNNLYC